MYIGPWQEFKLARFREHALHQFREEWKKQSVAALAGASAAADSDALGALITALDGKEQHVSLRDLRDHDCGRPRGVRAMATRSLGGAEADSSAGDGNSAPSSCAGSAASAPVRLAAAAATGERHNRRPGPGSAAQRRPGQHFSRAAGQLLQCSASASSPAVTAGGGLASAAGSRDLQAAAAAANVAAQDLFATSRHSGSALSQGNSLSRVRGARATRAGRGGGGGGGGGGELGCSGSSAETRGLRAVGTDSKRVAAMLRVCRRADSAMQPPSKARDGEGTRELIGAARVKRMKQVYQRGVAACAKVSPATSAPQRLDQAQLSVRYATGPNGPVAYTVQDAGSRDAGVPAPAAHSYGDSFRGWTPQHSASTDFTSMVSKQAGAGILATNGSADERFVTERNSAVDDDASVGSVDEADVDQLLEWTDSLVGIDD